MCTASKKPKPISAGLGRAQKLPKTKGEDFFFSQVQQDVLYALILRHHLTAVDLYFGCRIIIWDLMTVQSSMVALSCKLEAFSCITAQLSNGHVTCNQCKLLRIAKRLQRSGVFKVSSAALQGNNAKLFISGVRN